MATENINTLKGLIAKANRVMGKTLTTKDRKKLPDSAYCCVSKDRRAFPCHDCSHVAVAKSYLKRSKFSKNVKEKIAACINRRAKLLKCNVIKKAKAGTFPKFIELSYKEKKLYSSDIFKTTKKLVEESIKNQGKDINVIDIIV